MKHKRIKRFVKDQLQHRGFRLQNVKNINLLESLMYNVLDKNKSITLVQIGANDGIRFDPVHDFLKRNHQNLKAFVLEPVQDYFTALRETYGAYPNIHPVKLAIHNELELCTIYRVAKKFENKVPEMALGIASFDQDHHQKTNIPKEFMDQELVPCMSLDKFIDQHDLHQLDVLVIDTEGYDYNIIMQIDFNKCLPFIIHFEHGLSSGTMTETQLKQVIARLNANGYQAFVHTADVTAFRTNMFCQF